MKYFNNKEHMCSLHIVTPPPPLINSFQFSENINRILKSSLGYHKYYESATFKIATRSTYIFEYMKSVTF